MLHFVVSNLNILKDSVPVLLFDSKIALRHFIRRMVIDIDQQCRRNSLSPGLIAESLPQGMTADYSGDLVIAGGFFYNSERLYPGDGVVLIGMGE